MDWPTVVVIFLLLLFYFGLLAMLLRWKAIDSENTIRFACIAGGLLIVITVAFVPIANDKVSSGLIALAGTIFGYVIRDVAKKRKDD